MSVIDRCLLWTGVCYGQVFASSSCQGLGSLRVATGPKLTMGHILVKTHHIFIKFEDYISLVKVAKYVKNQLICITVAMATAVYVPMDVCPHGKNYSE